jgi:hypothetical protein
VDGQVSGVAVVKSTFEFYVSKQGSDATGTGSVAKPYLTIQKAIDEATNLSLTGTDQAVIYVGPGVYTESLFFSNGYISVVGSDFNSLNGGPVFIQGSIALQIGGANDLQNKQVAFSNLTILGAIVDTSTAQHTVALTNVLMFNNTATPFCLNIQATCTDARIRINNCTFNHQPSGSGVGAVIILVGQVTMLNSRISSNDSASLLTLGGTAIGSQIQFNNFENSNPSDTIAPLVRITSTSASPHTFGGCSFIYTSAVVKTSPNSSGILFSGGAAAQTMVAVGNVFSLNGTSNPSQHAIMKDATMGGVATCVFGGNFALLGADKIETGIVRVAASVVS